MTPRMRVLTLLILCLPVVIFFACDEDDDFGDEEGEYIPDDLEFTEPATYGSTLRVISWNLRHEGWSGETNYSDDAKQIWKNFGTSSTSPNGCDIAFLQEVMKSTAAAGIASELSKLSGVTWTSVTTPLIGRTSYKESYAVVYRTDRVTVEDWYVWSDVGDKFEREPMIVEVRDKTTQADYTFINWHAIFGTSGSKATTQRQAEIRQIATVFSAVQADNTHDQDVILLGDFNTPATSSWWSYLTALSPAVGWKVNDPTTLNSTGAYVSSYDHFWYQSSYLTEYSSSGRDYIADTLTFYDDISDHAPIWLKLYSTSDSD